MAALATTPSPSMCEIAEQGDQAALEAAWSMEYYERYHKVPNAERYHLYGLGPGYGEKPSVFGPNKDYSQPREFWEKGPDNNWASVETVNVKNICFSSYEGSDTTRFKSYWNVYPGINEKTIISAGQPESTSFQLSVYENNILRFHCLDVFYRDLIQVARINDKLVIVHCRGETGEHTPKGSCWIL